MGRASYVSAATFVLLAAGCASTPRQVQDRYDLEQRQYEVDMATAREWDVYTLGIPASGWVWILSLSAILITALLVAGGVAMYHALEDRRRKQSALDIEREKTKQAQLTAPTCQICGHDPRIIKET